MHFFAWIVYCLNLWFDLSFNINKYLPVGLHISTQPLPNTMKIRVLSIDLGVRRGKEHSIDKAKKETNVTPSNVFKICGFSEIKYWIE